MSEHELWNELGNLYFLSGAHEQAIHAYTRSIALEKKYGRAYCNMALTYVQKGKCNEAINLYERGVGLLFDDHEKALTWSKLGDVYRHLKDYRKAVQAYEWADVLDPDVRRSLDSSNKADVLLNRKTEISDVLSLVDVDETETQQDEKEEAASSSTSSLPPFLEELTPWNFEEQLPPPEEDTIHPLFDIWFSEETGVNTFAEGLITTEPLQWKQTSFEKESTDEQAALAEVNVVDTVDEISAEEEQPAIKTVQTEIEPVSELQEVVDVEAETTFEEISEIDTAVELQADVESEVMEVEVELTSDVSFEVNDETDASEEPEIEVVSVSNDTFEMNVETDVVAEAELTSEFPFEAEAEAEMELPVDVQAEDESESEIETVVETELDVELESMSEAVFEAEEAIIPEMQMDVDEDAPVMEMDIETESEPVMEVEAEFEMMSPELDDETQTDEDITDITSSLEVAAEDVTLPQAVQYEQVDQMNAVQLSPEEKSSLDLDIFRCQRILDINSDNPGAWDRLGGLYKTSGRYDEAVEAYQKAISLDREDATYRYHLGLVFAAQRRLEEAISAFEQVIEIEPDHGLAHAAIGSYHRRMGQEELAQAHIEKATSLMSDEENEYNRACMEAICGNTDRAFELLEIALKNKRTAVAWVQRDPDLDFIRSDPRFGSLIMEYGTMAQAV